MLDVWTHGNPHLDIFFLLARGVISWKSANQAVIVTFTMEAEFVAWFEATIQAWWLQNFTYGFGIVDSMVRLLTAEDLIPLVVMLVLA